MKFENNRPLIKTTTEKRLVSKETERTPLIILGTKR
jgi:hypothetical protein